MIDACRMFKIQVSANSAAESFFLKLPFYFEKCDLHCLSSKYSDTRHQLQSITCTSCLIYLDLKSSCFTILSAVCLMNFCLMHFFAKKTSISFSLSLSLSLIINVVLLIRGRRTFWEGFMFVYTVLQLKIFFSLWLHFRNTNDAKLHHDHVYLFWNTSLVVPIFSGKTNRFGQI